MAQQQRRDDAAVRITSAAPGRAEGIAAREKRYLISMGIRVLCFVGAIAVGPGWVRWVLIVGAVFLPYVAVVMANTAGNRQDPELPGAHPYGRELQ